MVVVIFIDWRNKKGLLLYLDSELFRNSLLYSWYFSI